MDYMGMESHMHILITGIQSRFAQLVGAVLAACVGVRVSGVGASLETASTVDSVGPMPRGRELATMIRALAPDVVVHLDQPGEETAGGRAGQLQTIDLLGACVAANTPRLVFRSNTYVYGATVENPAFIPETQPLMLAASPGLQTDYVAIERAIAECAADHPAMAIVILRCAPMAGSGVDSPLLRYLYQPRPLMVGGYDPRIQLLHADDAVIAFVLAAVGNTHGAYNLAAADVLTLGRAIRLAGRQPFALGSMAFSGSRLLLPLTQTLRKSLPFDPAFLQYACVADTRRATEELGWIPQYTAVDALRI